jgi:hypothetical protein
MSSLLIGLSAGEHVTDVRLFLIALTAFALCVLWLAETCG